MPLAPEDAARYAANSFTLQTGSESLLLMPDGLSESLLDQICERGTTDRRNKRASRSEKPQF